MAVLSCIGSFSLDELIIGIMRQCAIPIGVLGISIAAATTAIGSRKST